MINIFVWDDNLHTVTAHAAFGTIAEINTPKKKADRDWT